MYKLPVKYYIICDLYAPSVSIFICLLFSIIIEIIKPKFNSYSLVFLEDESSQYTYHNHHKKHSAVIHRRIPTMISSMIQIYTQLNQKFSNSKILKKIHFPRENINFVKSKYVLIMWRTLQGIEQNKKYAWYHSGGVIFCKLIILLLI